MPWKFPRRVLNMPELYREARVRRQRRECPQSHGSAFRRVVHRPQLLNTQQRAAQTPQPPIIAASCCVHSRSAFRAALAVNIAYLKCKYTARRMAESLEARKASWNGKLHAKNVFHSTSGNRWVGKEKHANLQFTRKAATNAESCEMTSDVLNIPRSERSQGRCCDIT